MTNNDVRNLINAGQDYKPSTSEMQLVRASDLKPEAIAWVWPGWLAGGKLQILAGSPGTGKTTIAMSLAATLSIGGDWPDGVRAVMGDTLIWSGEDDIQDSLLPRLYASGADLERIHFAKGMIDNGRSRSFDPSTDIQYLLEKARTIPDLRLVIIDPIVSAVSGDSHKNAEMRKALQPIVDLAQSLGCAVLGINHFSKGTQGRDPVDRVTGSLAFGAVPRVVLCTAKPAQQDGKRRLVRAKSNIGPDGDGVEYDLEVHGLLGHPDIFGQVVKWGEAIQGTARMLLDQVEDADAGMQSPALDEAIGFLQDELSDGPKPANAVKSAASDAGISAATLRRAKDHLVIKPQKDGMTGGWQWALPTGQPQSAADRRCSSEREDAHPNTINTFGEDEHLRGDWDGKGDV